LIRRHATLHAAPNAAVRAGEIPINSAMQAEVPRSRQAKIRPWPPEVYGTFLDHLDQTKDRMTALFQLAGHIGHIGRAGRALRTIRTAQSVEVGR
jgi:hypothetical protein